MPIYEYRCAKGHNFDSFQKIDDPPVTACEVCGAPVERVFHPIAVHFKGSGFYSTDYGRKGQKGATNGSDSKPAEKKSEGGEKKSDAKPSGEKAKSSSKD